MIKPLMCNFTILAFQFAQLEASNQELQEKVKTLSTRLDTLESEKKTQENQLAHCLK